MLGMRKILTRGEKSYRRSRGLLLWYVDSEILSSQIPCLASPKIGLISKHLLKE